MQRLSIVMFLLCAAGLCTTSAAGQGIEGRRGFWLAGAVSGSSVGIDCVPYCPDDRKLGISGFVQLGGTLSKKTLTGVELNGWRTSDSEAAREYISVMGIGHFYPALDYPFYIKFGLGAGRYGEEAGEDQMSATGFIIQLGVGYEWAITRRIWAGPLFQYMNSPDMNASRNRFGLSADFRINLLQVGGRIAWH